MKHEYKTSVGYELVLSEDDKWCFVVAEDGEIVLEKPIKHPLHWLRFVKKFATNVEYRKEVVK
jgi:hypothetical protein